MELKGVYTALVTPFRNGEVDYAALTALLEAQIAGKVAGVVPVGTTGESPTLTPEEHIKVIAKTVEIVNGRCQVIGQNIVIIFVGKTIKDFQGIFIVLIKSS